MSHPGPATPPPRFSDALEGLLAEVDRAPLTIGAIEQTLQGRGLTAMMIVLAAPFALPIPLPLLSTPVGLLIAMLGIRLAFGARPWLPARIRRHEVERGRLRQVLEASLRLVRPLERVLAPRWTGMFRPAMRVVCGVSIAAAALAMALPLPVPGANALPAFGIMGIAAGVLERDGKVAAVGLALVAATFGFLWVLWDLVQNVLGRIFP
jgi:hypothetical protein